MICWPQTGHWRVLRRYRRSCRIWSLRIPKQLLRGMVRRVLSIGAVQFLEQVERGEINRDLAAADGGLPEIDGERGQPLAAQLAHEVEQRVEGRILLGGGELP